MSDLRLARISMDENNIIHKSLVLKIWFLIQLPSFAIRYVGKLVGRYHDSQGNPTKYLKGVESKAKRGAQLEEKQKIEEAKIPSCNSKWSQEEGGEVLLLV